MQEYRHRSYGDCVKNLPHSCIAKVKNLAKPAFWYCIYDLLYGCMYHQLLYESSQSFWRTLFFCRCSWTLVLRQFSHGSPKSHGGVAGSRVANAGFYAGMWVESGGIAVGVSVSARSSWCRRSAKVGKRRQMWRWVWLESPNWKWGSFRDMSDMWYCAFLEVLVSFFQGIQTASEVVRPIYFESFSHNLFSKEKTVATMIGQPFFGLPNTEIQLLIYVFFVFFQDSWGFLMLCPGAKWPDCGLQKLPGRAGRCQVGSPNEP